MSIVWSQTALQVLDNEQLLIKSLLEEFTSSHILVGGTAIALQLGHRKSIDYDLFSFGVQGTGLQMMERIKRSDCMFDLDTAPRFWYSEEEQSELTLFFGGVKVQFIDFSRNPFDIPVLLSPSIVLCEGIHSLSLCDLGALKVYAMMYRKKMKDMIDLYFILQNTDNSLQMIIQRANEIFGRLYNAEYTYEAIFDTDRDETELVEYLVSYPPSFDQIVSYIRSEVDVLLLEVT